MKRTVNFLAVGLCLCGVAVAQDALKDPVEILKKADAATKKVKAVRYEGTFEATGALKDRVPQMKGNVLVAEGDATGERKLRIEAKIKPAGGEDELKLIIGTDGDEFYCIDHAAKKVTVGEGPEAFGRDGQMAGSLHMIEFTHPTPFSDEINADKSELKGVETIAGEKCYQIYVVYAGGGGKAEWYFSASDFLPRRVDRIRESEGERAATVLTITKLEADPKVTDADFQLDTPEGYQKVEAEAPEEPKLLEVGSKAPDWTLMTPGGESMSLSKLKGNVVLMDFWATWCGPCKMAMPHVQALHEKYKDKNVKILGINTWESGDPAAYMKEKNYTYGLLLKGDEVASAYKVSGIPTFYLIDPQGNIAYVSVGYNPNDKELEATIEKLLKSKQE